MHIDSGDENGRALDEHYQNKLMQSASYERNNTPDQGTQTLQLKERLLLLEQKAESKRFEKADVNRLEHST